MTRPGDAAGKESRALAQCAGQSSPKLLATLAACALHGVLLAGALALSKPTPSQAAKPQRELLEVELPPPPPAVAELPPPEPAQVPEPEPEKPAPQRKAVKAPPAPTPPPEVPEPPQDKPLEPPPPAPAAAQAAQALTASADAPQADATNGVVTGEGKQYAGGTTERGGSATHAVQAASARAFGVEGGTGTAAPDRSRPPQLASGLRWDCPTPDEALDEGVEHATVSLLVEVGSDGKLLSVEIKRDPGYGFAREARACALKKRFVPGLDKSGQPVRGKQLINVNF